jgi:hypothetical protein
MGFNDRPQQNTILFDDSGNPVGVMLDGAVYRIQGENLLVGKTASAGANKEVSVIDDVDDSNVKRLQIETTLKPGEVISTTPGAAPLTQRIDDFLLDGASPDMIVDGSGTPVVFSFPAESGAGAKDIVLHELRIVFVVGSLVWGDFGQGSTLSNGLLFEAITGSGSASELWNVQRNEDFHHLGIGRVNYGGLDDILVVTYAFSEQDVLVKDTADEVRVTVRDNIGLNPRGVEYLRVSLHASKEI